MSILDAIRGPLQRVVDLRPHPGPRPDVQDTESMLRDQLAEIEFRRDPDRQLRGETAAAAATRLEPTDLSLSGGGIRSAAFCLGVLQSLAAKKLLNQFDYLSTVSGGGFIGGWLQMAMREADDMESFQEALASPRFPPLHRLRAYTNYLTPETGPFSLDTWAGIMLYLRNFILNWMIFAPLFLLLALVPVIYRTLMAALHERESSWDVLVIIVGTASLTLAAWQGCALLPSHRTVNPPGFALSRAIFLRIVAPALVWSFLVSVSLDYGLGIDHLARSRVDWINEVQWLVPAAYVLALATGYVLAWMTSKDQNPDSQILYRKNALRWIAATLCVAGLTWISLRLIRPGGALYTALGTGGRYHYLLPDTETALAFFCPFWLTVMHVLQTTFYVGFRREALLADLDREWLARVSGVILQIGVAWTLFVLSCLVLPVSTSLLTANVNNLGLPFITSVTGTTVLGSVIAWLGKRLQTQIEAVTAKSRQWTTLLLNALCVLFAAGVFLTAGALLQTGLGKAQRLWLPPLKAPPPYGSLLGLQAILAILLSLLVCYFGRINVNRFSMHAVYRNRLTRAFLGSARRFRRRHPDPFTGFDPRDNRRFAKFAMGARQRLFHVVNMTLNVTAGSNTAWAERKAECFTSTPLACGAAALRNPNHQQVGVRRVLGAFVRTRKYAGMETHFDESGRNKGARLGSVLTVSGAAISPNWGYHSSRLTAFVMTLFNVRLGAWLPNPAVATPDELQLAAPRNSVGAIISELLGMTRDSRQAVYLSDGGHFENLGLYEMIRRRCRWIVVVDAGQDEDCQFFDLGNAIRKARIDLGAEITMGEMHIESREDIMKDTKVASSAMGFAIGDIVYQLDPVLGEPCTGKLIYLKPGFLAKIPADGTCIRPVRQIVSARQHNRAVVHGKSIRELSRTRALADGAIDQGDAGACARKGADAARPVSCGELPIPVVSGRGKILRYKQAALPPRSGRYAAP